MNKGSVYKISSGSKVVVISNYHNEHMTYRRDDEKILVVAEFSHNVEDSRKIVIEGEFISITNIFCCKADKLIKKIGRIDPTVIDELLSKVFVPSSFGGLERISNLVRNRILIKKWSDQDLINFIRLYRNDTAKNLSKKLGYESDSSLRSKYHRCVKEILLRGYDKSYVDNIH